MNTIRDKEPGGRRDETDPHLSNGQRRDAIKSRKVGRVARAASHKLGKLVD